MIERRVFLELCQRCAALPERFGIKQNVPDEWRVVYRGGEYYPVAYQLGFTPEGAARHTAVLHDIGAKSAVYADLNKIERKKQQ